MIIDYVISLCSCDVPNHLRKGKSRAPINEQCIPLGHPRPSFDLFKLNQLTIKSIEAGASVGGRKDYVSLMLYSFQNAMLAHC